MKRNVVTASISRQLRKLAPFERMTKLVFAEMLHFLWDRSDRTMVLFGEKDGHQARDNAFQLFRYFIENGRNDAYYVIRKSSHDRHFLRGYEKNVIYYHSLRHFIAIYRAKTLVMNDGFLDVYPSVPKVLSKTFQPIVYLNHGIYRYKKVFFCAGHYYGRIIRFVVSLNSERQIATSEMMSKKDADRVAEIELFHEMMRRPLHINSREALLESSKRLIDWAASRDLKRRQKRIVNKLADNQHRIAQHVGFPEARVKLYGLPRHDWMKESPRREAAKSPRVFFFLTWRDYWKQRISKEQVDESPFAHMIKAIMNSEALMEVCKRHNATIEIALHQKVSSYANHFRGLQSDHIKLASGPDPLSNALRSADLLVTDYSSVALDFCLAGVPVAFYQPDFDIYDSERGTYVSDTAGWVGPRSDTLDTLANNIGRIISGELRSQAMLETQKLRDEYSNLGNSRSSLLNEIYSLPPRVTFICYNIFGIGGTVSAVTNIANRLYEDGYLVDIISLRRTSKAPALGLHPSIQVTSLLDFTNGGSKGLKWYERKMITIRSLLFNKKEDLYSGANLLTDIRLALALRRTTTDVLISTVPSFAAIALRFKRSGTRLIAQEHKFLSAHHLSIQKLIRKAYSKADGMMCLTRQDASEYAEITGLTPYVIPNGAPQNTHARNTEDLVVVALGRLDEQKQFHLLIAAFAATQDKHPDWQLHIYGQGAERNRLLQLISETGQSDRIILMGPTSDSARVIAAASICAVSSSYEGFGMVFIEAYAAAKPVITFDIERGPKDVVIDGVTGLKAVPFSVEDYAGKLDQLMADKGLRQELGRNGHKMYTEEFDVEVTVDRFKAAIQEVCSG